MTALKALLYTVFMFATAAITMLALSWLVDTFGGLAVLFAIVFSVAWAGVYLTLKEKM